MKRFCDRSPFRNTLKSLAPAILLACTTVAGAFEFKTEGGITGSFDTTISYGISIRASSRDQSLIGLANGGTSRSVNEDDGNRAYDKGDAFANVLKATHDLEMKYRNFGLFVRGTYFYDFENEDRDTLGPTGKDRLGKDARFLDAFVSASFDLGGRNLRLRVGDQVVSWGESTFIPNGINVINPVDLGKLRIPGSELKEAFIPSTMVWASQQITDDASVEGFYLANFDKIRLDPRGSYFSSNDFGSDDGFNAILSFGRRHDLTRPPRNPVPPGIPNLSTAAQGLYGPFDPAAAIWAPRIADRDPSDSGQYGIALRYLASALNNTELGLYFMNYHSRIPMFSAIKGTPTSVLTGGPLIPTICATPALAALCHTGTATYFAEYPEDIKLYGLSFSTQGPFGIALQGEYAYRPKQPVQLATPELLLAALGLPNLITGFTQLPGAPAGATAAALVPNGAYLQGWRSLRMSQLQLTATKAMPNIVGADQLVLVGEVGFTKYHNLPDDLKFNGPAVFLPGTAFGALIGQAGSVQPDGYLTRHSWGYRLVGRLDYPNMLFGANMSPRLAFAHDVDGVSQTFNEGIKSLSAGVNFEYQKKVTVDLSYTSYFGGRTYCGADSVAPSQTSLAAQVAVQGANWCSSAYPIKDRDFYSIVLTYSF